MKLKDIYTLEKPVISYEIFPPKSRKEDLHNKMKSLFDELSLILKFNPSFISVTYGAGGSTREKTLDIVLKIKKDLKITPMPHFTCVGMEKNEIREYLNLYKEADIKNILALRGDPPKGQENFKKLKNGFGYANELVDFIKESTNFSVAVAGYPECHQECSSLDIDILNLKRKVDAGADVVITQLFYKNDLFFDFVEKCQNSGINIPIIPGILPITNLAQIEKIASLCSCALPQELIRKMQKYEDDFDAIERMGIEYSVQQCRELLENNISGLHFYTLNKAFAVEKTLNELNIKKSEVV